MPSQLVCQGTSFHSRLYFVYGASCTHACSVIGDFSMLRCSTDIYIRKVWPRRHRRGGTYQVAIVRHHLPNLLWQYYQ